MSGSAGTGKTFIMEDVSEYAKRVSHLNKGTLFTAPTNKAVKVLKGHLSQNTTCATTHSALSMKEHITDKGALTFVADKYSGPPPASKYSAVIVDEASMIDDSLFWPLLDLSEAGVKIIFVGDAYQVPPVNYDDAIPFNKESQKEYGIEVFTMTEIIRQAQGSPIIETAQVIRNNIYDDSIKMIRDDYVNDIGSVKHVRARHSFQFLTDLILPMFKTPEYENDIDFVKIIAWKNESVNRYNKAVRQYVFGEGIPMLVAGDKLIADSPVFESDHKTIAIATNSEMMVLGTTVDVENYSDDYSIKFYRAHVKVYDSFKYNEYILKIVHEDSIPVYNELLKMQANLAKSFPAGSQLAKSSWYDYYNFIKHWAQVKYSYCITTHKSQGSTYRTACALEYDIMTNRKVYERNRILYTACTRPSKELYVIY